MADEIEIHHVALPERVRSTQSSLGVAGGCEETGPEFFRIGFPDSNGCKHPRFVAAPLMPWVETILPELPNIDNGTVAIGQFHNEPIVTARGCRHKREVTFFSMPR